MEAVFSRDFRGLFAAESPQKSFYHPSPTTPRAKGTKSIKKTSASTLNKAHHQPRPLKPLTGSSPPNQLATWDLVQFPPDPQGGGIGMANLSSGSSKFNESWPSKSDDSGCGFGVGATNPLPEGPTEDRSCTISKSNSQELTLARYIERFRQAPPTSRASREAPGSPFWWKQQQPVLATHPQETSTPNSSTAQAKGHLGADSDHTHTDPSPRVSPGLDSRCQSVVEKAAELFTSSTSSDSPPAQKYLNTLQGERGKQGLHPQPPRLTAGLWQREDIGTHPLSPAGDDILAQWRLRRKLEQARSETTLGLNMSHHAGHVGAGEGGGVTCHIGPVSRIACCAGHCCHAAEDEGLCGRGLARTCLRCQRAGGRGQDQTTPGLLNREQEVCGETEEEDGTAQSLVRRVASQSGGQSGGGSGQSGGGSGHPGGGRGQSGGGSGQSGGGSGLSSRLERAPVSTPSVAQVEAGVQPTLAHPGDEEDGTAQPLLPRQEAMEGGQSGGGCGLSGGGRGLSGGPGDEENGTHQTDVVTPPAGQTSHSSSETSFSLESIAESAAGHGAEPPHMHGGLALRDLTLSSDGEDSTMTFSTERDDTGMERGSIGMERGSMGMERGNTGMERGERDNMGMEKSNMGMERGNMGMERGNMGMEQGGGDRVVDSCNTATLQHLSHQSTSTPTKCCHEPETPCLNEEGSPLGLPPTHCAPEQCDAVTSKVLMPPLQKSDRIEASAKAGFPSVPWDYDMDDELLKLLITKARLFEAQIREINGLLMELEGREQ